MDRNLPEPTVNKHNTEKITRISGQVITEWKGCSRRLQGVRSLFQFRLLDTYIISTVTSYTVIACLLRYTSFTVSLQGIITNKLIIKYARKIEILQNIIFTIIIRIFSDFYQGLMVWIMQPGLVPLPCQIVLGAEHPSPLLNSFPSLPGTSITINHRRTGWGGVRGAVDPTKFGQI